MNLTKSALSTIACLVLFVSAGIFINGCDSTDTPSPKPAGSDSADSGSTSTLKGEIKINGSSTVQPIANAIREMFVEQHPGVSVNVDGAGTSNGFKDFYAKSTDISDASRPIKPAEVEACKKAGVEFVELAVAYDGVTVVVHPENDWATKLTIDQLKKIFVADNPAMKWKDVDASWPDEKINIFSPGTGSGTYDYVKEVLAKKDDKELREDMSLNEDDNVLVKGVASNKFAIGFFGVAYYEENKNILKAAEIVNPKDGKAYLPTKETIANNQYAPFSRPLFVYVNTQSFNKPEVQTFVEFFLENVSETCEKVGYVRLPSEIIEAAKSNMDSLATGTHFVDADGNSRSGGLADIYKAENLTK